MPKTASAALSRGKLELTTATSSCPVVLDGAHSKPLGRRRSPQPAEVLIVALPVANTIGRDRRWRRTLKGCRSCGKSLICMGCLPLLRGVSTAVLPLRMGFPRLHPQPPQQQWSYIVTPAVLSPTDKAGTGLAAWAGLPINFPIGVEYMFKKTRVSTAVLVAIGGSLGLATLPALAQQAVERIEITGSAIKRIDAETVVPVTTFRAEDLRAQGITSIEQIL